MSTLTATSTGSVSVSGSITATASPTLSLGLRQVKEVFVIKAVSLTMDMGPVTAKEMRIASVACALRTAWAERAGTLIEFVFIAGITEPGGSVTKLNASDPANVACNRNGMNSSDAVVESLLSETKLGAAVGGGKTRRLRQLHVVSHAERLVTASFAPHFSRGLTLQLATSASSETPNADGTSSISVNILSGPRAASIAASLKSASAADLSEGMALAREALANATGKSPSNISSSVRSNSIEVIELSYTRSYWGIFLDFLLANIRAVIGGTSCIIFFSLFLSWYKTHVLRKLAQDKFAAAKDAEDSINKDKAILRKRMLRARVRANLRALVLLHRSQTDMAAVGHFVMHRARVERAQLAQEIMEDNIEREEKMLQAIMAAPAVIPKAAPGEMDATTATSHPSTATNRARTASNASANSATQSTPRRLSGVAYAAVQLRRNSDASSGNLPPSSASKADRPEEGTAISYAHESKSDALNQLESEAAGLSNDGGAAIDRGMPAEGPVPDEGNESMPSEDEEEMAPPPPPPAPPRSPPIPKYSSRAETSLPSTSPEIDDAKGKMPPSLRLSASVAEQRQSAAIRSSLARGTMRMLSNSSLPGAPSRISSSLLSTGRMAAASGQLGTIAPSRRAVALSPEEVREKLKTANVHVVSAAASSARDKLKERIAARKKIVFKKA